MHFDTKKQAKTTVSALRRELKGFTKPASELSHSDCLTILAKAMGHKSWNELEASLPADTGAPVKAVVTQVGAMKYPLRNTGQFDFVKSGDDGQLVTGHFAEVVGSSERLKGTCSPDAVKRRPATGLAFDFCSGTEVDWNSQKTAVNARGDQLWLDCNYKEVPESALVLLPEGYCAEDAVEDEDEVLPVRQPLVEAFLEYFREAGTRIEPKWPMQKVQPVIEQAEVLLGFSMTEREVEALLDAYSVSTLDPAEEPSTSTAELEVPREEALERLAYRKVFNRVFADEGDEGGTWSSISKVMDALTKATPAEMNQNAELLLQRKVSELITLNGPYDGCSVADMASRLRHLAKTAYERLLLLAA